MLISATTKKKIGEQMGGGQMQKASAAAVSNQPNIQAKLQKQAGIVNFLRENCHPELANVSFSEKNYPGPKEMPNSQPSKPPLVYPSAVHWQEERGAIGEFREFIDLQGCVRKDLLNEGNAGGILTKLEAAKSSVEKIPSESGSKKVPVFIERGYIPVGILIFEKAE